MMNLLKYEWLKGRNKLLGAIGIYTVVALIFIFQMSPLQFKDLGFLGATFATGILNPSDTKTITMIGLFGIGSLVLFLTILFRGISSFNKELKSSSRFSLFGTPTKIEFIVAAKYIMVSLFSIIAIVFVIILSLIVSNRTGLSSPKILGLGMNGTVESTVGVARIFSGWLSFYAIAVFVITFMRMIYQKKPFSFILGLVLFIGIQVLIDLLLEFLGIPGEKVTILSSMGIIVYNLLIIGLFAYLTILTLEKRLNV